MGFIIIIVARGIAMLFHDNPLLFFTLTLIGCIAFLLAALKYREEYLKILRSLKEGWKSLAAVSLLFYIMIYMLIAYPVPMIERREYVPVALLFGVTIMFVYIVIYQTIMRAVIIYDEQKDKALLKMQIELQNSQLELKEVYYKMAYTDILTGLKSRAAYEEKKKELYADNKQLLSCLAMDLNNLKETNDSFGHDKGDELIKTFASILKETFFYTDDIYRIGGDEFLMFFSGASSGEADKHISDLRQRIEQHNKESEINISVAIGISTMNEKDIKDLHTLVLCADKDMYKNKASMKF